MKKQHRNSPAEICSFCGQKTARLTARTHAFGKGSEMIVIESVPTWSCDNCGEVYITAEVSRAIDEVIAHPELHTKKRPVKIASLAA
ncbi:MAG: type II toxin-antitoxin system MqsA family antitoxin [Acidobacteriota bacterium]|nr:type II toxin-antitoxin system MqsA family antitoxin [Acidobacteriota bacterium]